MKPAEFRNELLSNSSVQEKQHHGHPDFRVGGRVVASLEPAPKSGAMLKLTIEQQAAACSLHPQAFQPITGAWGKRGYTRVNLSAIEVVELQPWIELAIGNEATQ